MGLAGIGFGSLNSLRTSNSLCGSFATKQYQPDLCLWPVVLFLMTLARFIRITRKLLSSIYSDVIMLMMFGGLVVDRPRGDDWIAWIKQASHRFGNMVPIVLCTKWCNRNGVCLENLLFFFVK